MKFSFKRVNGRYCSEFHVGCPGLHAAHETGWQLCLIPILRAPLPLLHDADFETNWSCIMRWKAEWRCSTLFVVGEQCPLRKAQHDSIVTLTLLLSEGPVAGH